MFCEDKGENPTDAEMRDPCTLTDDDLKAALLKYGVKAGPIVGEVALNTVGRLIFIVEIGYLMY